MNHQNKPGDTEDTASRPPQEKGFGTVMNLMLALSVVVITVIMCRWMITPSQPSTRRLETKVIPASPAPGFTVLTQAAPRPSVHSYVDIRDTVVAHNPIVILTPRGASAQNVIGMEALSDPEAVMVMECAEVIMENPEERCLRKGLARIAGRQSVVMSKRRISGHDFKNVIMLLGAASYLPLPGTTAYGSAVKSNGEKREYGAIPTDTGGKKTFIVWK